MTAGDEAVIWSTLKLMEYMLALTQHCRPGMCGSQRHPRQGRRGRRTRVLTRPHFSGDRSVPASEAPTEILCALWAMVEERTRTVIATLSEPEGPGNRTPV